MVLAGSAVAAGLVAFRPSDGVLGAAQIWTGLILLVTVIVIIRRILADTSVTLQSIYAALSAYIIIGLMFAAFYAAMNRLGSSYAFVGDCRFNMGRSLLVMGALMGSDVRLAGPAELHPPKDVVQVAEDIARRTGAGITITEDPAEAVSGTDFIHTDVQ